MDTVVKKIDEKELTGQDLSRMTGLNNIIPYHDLNRINSVNQLLGGEDAVIILYELQENVGHWVLLWRSRVNELQFFDSYGIKLDGELKFANYNYRMHNNKITPHLTSIIENSGYSVSSNKKQLQEFKLNVNDCGRWVALRYLYRNLTHDEFDNLFLNQKNKPDFYVGLITLLL